jgi:3-mercaptopropionate dioxygenase
MCDFGKHHHDHDVEYGYLVDTPEVRALVEETQRLSREITDDALRVDMLRSSFGKLLASEGWLPEEFASPDHKSGMGGGIGQYALYRAEDGSLCLFSLVIPAGSTTPVHDHLAWGLVGVYRGEQEETIYRRVDDGAEEGHAELEVSRTQHVKQGDFYTLLPPRDDIHYVKTVSETDSVSIHLLANDTACVWRHSFNPEQQTVKAFRSRYSNTDCPEEEEAAAGHQHHHHG